MDRFDLGSHSTPVTTSSGDAQRWFDLGFNWCLAFNKPEGLKCFRKVLEFDPDCTMAYWGIAYAAGPFYNLVWRELGEQEAKNATRVAHENVQTALALSQKASDLEQQLVAALAQRFQQPHPVSPEEFDRWDHDYAAAMRGIYDHYPDNHDVMALLVEALITRTPRRLWDVKSGLPMAGSDVIEAIAVCERSMALSTKAGTPPHPAILHFHIHALEMADNPERSMQAADALAAMPTDAGHMIHMPGHIYVLCGDYQKARAVSVRATRANDRFIAYAGALTPYTTACAHDIHLLMYACMFLGRYADSMAAANKMCALLTRDVLSVQNRPKFAMGLEGYYSMKMHVMVRFGRWQDIIDEPMPDDPALYLVTTTMHHYAKGVAHASLKQIPQAKQERARFHESLARIPGSRRFFNNDAHAVLGVAEKMLDGELEYHKGNFAAAYRHLRESVRRDDNLEYIEPWAWMHPPRHALGALLAEQGFYAEAEITYREDLGLNRSIQRCAQHPDNVWALHGLVECLVKRGETEELPGLQRKLAMALQAADIAITSSCLCRTGVAVESGCCGSARGT
jgi:tetratricopeptide (TPR) repeat protein